MAASEKKNNCLLNLVLCAAMLLFLASLSGGPHAEEAAPQAELFTGNLLVQNAPSMGIARLKITIERWTTDEERKKLVEAIRSGGTEALADAMEKMEAGYIQVDNNLRWPIRVASTWKTDKGRMVRIATNRQINIVEVWKDTRSFDYPIGLAEMLLPPEGKGEGILLAATQVEFNAEGRLEVKSLPQNVGPQKITNVKSEMIKLKKSKKK